MSFFLNVLTLENVVSKHLYLNFKKEMSNPVFYLKNKKPLDFENE